MFIILDNHSTFVLLKYVDDVADAIVDFLVEFAYLAQLYQGRAFVGVGALLICTLQGLLDHQWLLLS